MSDRKQLCLMDPIDRSDHLTDHAHARQDQARAETSKTEVLVLYDALPAWHDIVPTVKYCPTEQLSDGSKRTVGKVDLYIDCQHTYWTCLLRRSSVPAQTL